MHSIPIWVGIDQLPRLIRALMGKPISIDVETFHEDIGPIGSYKINVSTLSKPALRDFLYAAGCFEGVRQSVADRIMREANHAYTRTRIFTSTPKEQQA